LNIEGPLGTDQSADSLLPNRRSPIIPSVGITNQHDIGSPSAAAGKVLSDQNDEGSVPATARDKSFVFSGGNSVASIVRLRAQRANGALARDVGPVLGLQNTFTCYPFMDAESPQDRWQALSQIIPHRKEILK
jgi:hypothetical protein